MGVCPQPLFTSVRRLAKALVWPGMDQSRLWAPSEVCRGLPCPGPLCPAVRTCAHLWPCASAPSWAAESPDPGVQLLTSCPEVAMATWQGAGWGEEGA